MKFKSLEVNRRSNEGWFFNLVFEDNDGYRVVVNKENFKSKIEAEAIAQIKKNEYEKISENGQQ